MRETSVKTGLLRPNVPWGPYYVNVRPDSSPDAKDTNPTGRRRVMVTVIQVALMVRIFSRRGNMMKAPRYFRLAVVLICAVGPAVAADAADGTTIWNFLGIPQGIQKIKDASINRRGNHPGWERKPALRGIADPANLEDGQAKVVQDAAKIKMKEDQAKQKIKAIKYLAKIGCGCHEGVADALLSALDDCTEEVRLEAAKAFEAAAGDGCEKCGGTGCCNAKTMTKLYEMACAQDEKGCYKESSERVRAAALTAMRACRRVVPMVPASDPVGPGPEDTIERIPATPGAEDSPFRSEEPLPIEEQGPQVPTPASPDDRDTSGIVNPITLTGMSQVDTPQFSGRRPAVARKPPTVSRGQLVAVRRIGPPVVRRIGPPAPGHSRSYVSATPTVGRRKTAAPRAESSASARSWRNETLRLKLR